MDTIIVDASEVASVLVNGSGKINGEDFAYEEYIYPNGRPQGESVIMNKETKEAFSVVTSARAVDPDTYLGTTKGSKAVDKIFAPYTDYKIELVPVASATVNTVFYYNQDNLIDNLPNVLGQVKYGISDSQEYYELYKNLFESNKGFILYDKNNEVYVRWADFNYLQNDEGLYYTHDFSQSVVTATDINVLKALLRSKYSNRISYPVQVLKYTTDNEGSRVVDLDKVYGEFTNPVTFVSSDSLKSAQSQEQFKNKL